MLHYQLWFIRRDWKNSTISCNASWKIAFGCKWRGHAHERESYNSFCVWRRIFVCNWTYCLSFWFIRGTTEHSWNGFLAIFDEFNIRRNPMLTLTVFPGQCVKLSPYLDKHFQNFLQVNSLECSQDLTIAPYWTRVSALIAKKEDIHLFRKATSFRLHKNVLDTGLYTYHVYCLHDESKHPLMLNNPNPKSITNKNGNLGYTLLDCTQEATQTMSVIDNVAFFDFV